MSIREFFQKHKKKLANPKLLNSSVRASTAFPRMHWLHMQVFVRCSKVLIH